MGRKQKHREYIRLSRTLFFRSRVREWHDKRVIILPVAFRLICSICRLKFSSWKSQSLSAAFCFNIRESSRAFLYDWLFNITNTGKKIATIFFSKFSGKKNILRPFCPLHRLTIRIRILSRWTFQGKLMSSAIRGLELRNHEGGSSYGMWKNRRSKFAG